MLHVDFFESSATDGVFDFTVKIDGIEVGYNALEANFKKVFGVEGAEKLDMSNERWDMGIIICCYSHSQKVNKVL